MRATRAEELPLGRRVAAFAVLMVFEFFYGWSWNTVDVLRPQIRAALELTLTQAGTAYSAQSLGALVGAVVLGQLADHHGRRRTLVAIVAGYAVCGGLGAVVASYPQLLAQRFGLGFFLGGIFPVLIATYMGLFADRLRGKLAALGQGTYNVAVIALGQAYRVFGEGDGWHTLLLAGAIPPLVLLPLLLVVPDDRRVRAWGAATAPPPLARLPVVALFAPDLRRTTLLMFLLVGLNFFGYQAFAGWVTTYLKEVKHFGADVAGDVISRQFVGAVLGGFFWGWSTDRFGRRSAAWGFFHWRGGGGAVSGRARQRRRAAVRRRAVGVRDHQLGRLGAMDERAVPRASALDSDVDLQLGALDLVHRAADHRAGRRAVRAGERDGAVGGQLRAGRRGMAIAARTGRRARRRRRRAGACPRRAVARRSRHGRTAAPARARS